jgi:hypothetical protein
MSWKAKEVLWYCFGIVLMASLGQRIGVVSSLHQTFFTDILQSWSIRNIAYLDNAQPVMGVLVF